jgi:hypothetical protein
LAYVRHYGRVWTVDEARGLAGEHLSCLGDRWAHVQAVGSLAEALVVSNQVAEVLACAAWLHDLGYAPTVRRTGFHPVDGAVFLLDADAPLANWSAWLRTTPAPHTKPRNAGSSPPWLRFRGRRRAISTC